MRDLFDSEELAAVFEDGELPDMEEIRGEILETGGISSAVYEDGVLVGHILLGDYDDDVSFPLDDDRTAEMTRQERIEDEIEGREGIHALLRSSSGSYHVWDLGVAPLRARVIDALRLHGDPMHTAVSLRRGQFILRCTPKVYSHALDDGDAAVYKEAPELVSVSVEDSVRPQSRGHLEMLRAIAEEQDRLDRVPVEPGDPRFNWRGDRDDILTSRYLTVTDELKREVW